MNPTPLADPLRQTVRFLGRVLGDVIRAQDGEALFNRIEDIRQTSVAFHREGSADRSPALAARLEGLDLTETVRFVHSFACFLQMVNIAEDHIHRRRAREADADGLVRQALDQLRSDGVGIEEVRALLAKAFIAPVFTAHPTEVRRKSVLDRAHSIIADLDSSEPAATASQRCRI